MVEGKQENDWVSPGNGDVVLVNTCTASKFLLELSFLQIAVQIWRKRTKKGNLEVWANQSDLWVILGNFWWNRSFHYQGAVQWAEPREPCVQHCIFCLLLESKWL